MRIGGQDDNCRGSVWIILHTQPTLDNDGGQEMITTDYMLENKLLELVKVTLMTILQI